MRLLRCRIPNKVSESFEYLREINLTIGLAAVFQRVTESR